MDTPLPTTILLVNQADQAFFGPAWHGPCLLPTLRKLRVSEALKVSPFEGYTAWGVALHTGYWKYRGLVLLAKASGGAVEKPERFFRGPADWPSFPDQTDEAAWKQDVEHLVEVHLAWKAGLAAFPAELWDQPVRSDGTTAAAVAFGVAAHDLYHTAQIRNMGVKGF